MTEVFDGVNRGAFKMREVGRVIRIEGNRGIIQMDAKGGCRSCGMNMYCQSTGSGNRELSLELGEGVYSPGDIVEVETPARSYLMASFLVFILPLILSMAAYFVVFTLTKQTGYGVMGFFSCFILSEFLIAGIDKLFGRKRFFEPMIVRRIE